MLIKQRKLLRLLSAALILSGCASTPSVPQIERVIVFGDSNVDNGNLYRLSGQAYPAPPRWAGRESDGPVVVEYLAKSLHASLLDFAVSGATTGVSNIIRSSDPRLQNAASTGMTSQLEDFFHSDAAPRSTDLVVIWAGSNDIFEVQRNDRKELQQRINTATSNLEHAIGRLVSRGARHIIVANRPPRVVIGSDNDLNGIDLNAAISAMVDRARATYPATVVLYDDYAAIADMMHNPARYGFSDVSHQCVQVPSCAEQNADTDMTIADTYVHWDGAHKTTRVHRLMAEQIVRLLTN